MNEQIVAWLKSDRDYFEGLALYERYGSSANQKRILRKSGYSKKNLNTVVYELTKLSKVAPRKVLSVAPVVKQQKPEPVAPVKPKEGISVLVPKVEFSVTREQIPEVESLVRYVKNLQKVGASMQSSLSLLEKSEDRLKTAQRILDIYDEVDDIYNRLRVFEKTGSLPPSSIKPKSEGKKKLSEMDIRELMQRQSTLRTLISKSKKREANAVKLDTRANNIRLRERYELELAEISERLKR